MERLSYSFVLAYHGCDRETGLRLVEGSSFHHSDNDWDWLGPGAYFWEANPLRGLDWAREQSRRKGSRIREPFVVGAVIDLGRCLDLSTEFGVKMAARAHESLGHPPDLPKNLPDGRRKLDCLVFRHLHEMLDQQGLPPYDTVRGVFTEGRPAFEGAGFLEKTHIQIAVRNLSMIKGVFRVPDRHLREPSE